MTKCRDQGTHTHVRIGAKLCNTRCATKPFCPRQIVNAARVCLVCRRPFQRACCRCTEFECEWCKRISGYCTERASRHTNSFRILFSHRVSAATTFFGSRRSHSVERKFMSCESKFTPKVDLRIHVRTAANCHGPNVIGDSVCMVCYREKHFSTMSSATSSRFHVYGFTVLLQIPSLRRLPHILSSTSSAPPH